MRSEARLDRRRLEGASVGTFSAVLPRTSTSTLHLSGPLTSQRHLPLGCVMVIRNLVRAPLRFRRIYAPTVSVLSCRTPFSPSINPTGQRTLAQYSKPEQDEPNKPQEPRILFGKDKLTTELDGRPVSLSYIRLRDHCRCPRCVDPHSQQRNFRTSDIPVNIKAKSLKWDKDILWATWDRDVPGFDASHVSAYSLQQLQHPIRYAAMSSVGPHRTRARWNQRKMQVYQHWISYRDYMHDDEEFAKAMRSLSVYGLVFVKDIPDSREMVEKIATRIGPLRNSFYGPTWDVRKVPQAKNVAYTSQFLGFHMDLMYMNEPPAVQLLHCLQNSCDGGESLFVDTFQVAKYMAIRFPKEFETLTKTSLRYEYHHKDHSYSRSRMVIDTARLDGPGPHITNVNYSPPFQGPEIEVADTPSASVQWQREQIKALGVFAHLLEKESNMFELKLKPGQCVIFENRRVAHARRQFNTGRGERWLAGAYLDEDVVRSRYRVLQDAYPGAWLKFNKTHEDLRENALYASAVPSAPVSSNAFEDQELC